MVASAPGPEFGGNARFELRRRLGAGSYGVVFEALDRERSVTVALKTLRELQPEALYRFKREFRALADVRHENLVRLHELVSDGDQWFFTMELVEGRDFLAALGSEPTTTTDPRSSIDGLSHTVRLAPAELARFSAPSTGAAASHRAARAPVDPDRLRPLLRQLATGVAALHRRGMQHRDLKPSNVLVTPAGRVVILDFGLVSERHGRRSDAAQIVGTVEYMAPEQAAGLPTSPASDWYSVGVMLFEALTGELPFSGTLLEMLTQRIEQDAPSVRARNPEVPTDLAALCMALLARDPEHRPSDAEVLALLGSDLGASSTSLSLDATRSGAHASAVLVGRNDELARLAEALADARAGRASVVRLRGAPGLGRSALLEHFLAALEHESSTTIVLSARCSERESVPYKGVDGLLDALARELHSRDEAVVARLLPPHLATLARLFPVLRRIPAIARANVPPTGHSGDDSLAPHELRQRAFAALRALLGNLVAGLLASTATLVLAIDDLHWGDRDSAALLRELLAAPDPPPLLLIATHRSDAAPGPCVQALLDLPPQPRLVRHDLELGPLSLAAANELARALLLGSPRRGDAEALALEAGGNPLFLAELCRFVGDHGDGQNDPELADFDDLLRRRVAGLDLASRALLEVAAVAAEPIDPAIVAAVARHQGEPQPIFAALRREHLLRSHRADGQTTIEPFHDRVSAAVLADVDPARARQIHRDLADALERAATPDIERLRVHLEAAGETQRATAYTLQAAARASAALAFERAAALYRAALVHAPASERPRLEVLLGEALASDGRGIEAAEAFLRAAAANAGEPALDLLRRAGFERLRGGQIDEGITVLRQVLASVGMQLSATRAGALFALIGHRIALAFRGLRFRERPESAIPRALLRRADVAWSVGASGLGMVDDIAAGQFQSLALRLALRAGEPLRICRALAGEVAFSAVGGTRSLRRTARLLQTARTLAERLDQPHLRGTLAMTAGIAAYLGGRFREAHEATSAAEAILRRCPEGAWDLVNAQIFGLAAHVYQGELAAVGQRVAPLLHEAETRGNLYLLASLRGGPTHLHALARGAVDEAAASVDEAERRWSARGVQLYWQLHTRCNIDLYRGDPARALARLERAWGSLGTLLRIQLVRVEALHLRGRCLLASLGPERRVLADARAIEAEQTPWGDALAALLRAGTAARAGEIERAIHHLAAAAAGCEAAGMGLLAVAARRRRGELQPGPDGQRWRSNADAWLESQEVADTPRLLATLVPGFPTRALPP